MNSQAKSRHSWSAIIKSFSRKTTQNSMEKSLTRETMVMEPLQNRILFLKKKKETVTDSSKNMNIKLIRNCLVTLVKIVTIVMEKSFCKGVYAKEYACEKRNG